MQPPTHHALHGVLHTQLCPALAARQRRTRLLDFVEAGGYSTLLQLLGLVPSHWGPADGVHPLLRGFNRLSLGLFPTSDDLSLCLDCLVAKALVSLTCCMHASGLSSDLARVALRDEPFAARALEACLAIMSPSARFHLEERETASLTVLHLSHLIELHSKDEGSPMLLCLQRQILESAPALLDAILETRSSVSLTCNILTALTSLLQTPQPAEFAHLLHLILRACRKFVEPRMSRSVLHGCVNVMAAIVVSNSGLCEAHARQMTAGADLTWAALLIAQHEQTSEPPPNGLGAMRRLTSCLDGQYGREMKLVVEGGEKGPLFSGEGADEARELALRLGWIKPATKAEEMRLEEMRCEAEETCKEISFCSNPACRIDALTCALKKCARCGIAHYCSAGCQKVDWRRHKKLCKQSAEGAQ